MQENYFYRVLKISVFLSFIPGVKSWGYENRCSTRSTGSVQSLCLDRTIPASKARNFNRNSQTLKCSSGVDHYIRSQQKFNFEEWNNLLLRNQSQQAQNLRKTQPDVQWAGAINYNTVETWSWQDCQLITSGSACGYTTRYRTVTKYRQVCRGSGKNSSCSTESYSARESYEDPNTCWSDITQYEQWPCSQETMTYTAHFQRPNYESWKPGVKEYLDAIPNKYDLLPGEIEDVQSFSNTSLNSVISPKVEIGDAWNKYEYSITGSGVGAVCKQNNPLQINVVINTIARNTGKKTPNAFKLPRDLRGNAVDAIEWQPLQSDTGEMILKGQPILLRLADSSSGIINALAAQSEKTAEREALKQKQGEGLTPDASTAKEQFKAGFFKNTKVKVQLVKKNKVLWDSKATRSLILSQNEGIVPSTNILSKDQEIANSDIWEITLKTPENLGVYASRVWGSQRALRPGQDYALQVSMYQKGARGLYLQDCEEDPTFWSCKFRWLGLGKTEANLFSDPLDVPFKTQEKIADQRGWLDQFIDWVN